MVQNQPVGFKKKSFPNNSAKMSESLASFCAVGAFEEDEIIAVGVVVGWGDVSGVLSGSGDVGGFSGFGDTVGDDGGSVVIMAQAYCDAGFVIPFIHPARCPRISRVCAGLVTIFMGPGHVSGEGFITPGGHHPI